MSDIPLDDYDQQLDYDADPGLSKSPANENPESPANPVPESPASTMPESPANTLPESSANTRQDSHADIEPESGEHAHAEAETQTQSPPQSSEEAQLSTTPSSLPSIPQEYGLRDISSAQYDRPIPRGPRANHHQPGSDHNGVRTLEPSPQEEVVYTPSTTPLFDVTRALFIANLRKPINAAFFQANLKRVALEGGDYIVERAWLNRARTHAIILVNSEEGAVYLRSRMLNSIYPSPQEEAQLQLEIEEKEQRRYDREVANGDRSPLPPQPYTVPERMPLFVEFIPVKAINQWIYEEDHGPRDGLWKIEYETVGDEIVASHTLLNGSFIPEFRRRDGRGGRNRRDNRDGRDGRDGRDNRDWRDGRDRRDNRDRQDYRDRRENYQRDGRRDGRNRPEAPYHRDGRSGPRSDAPRGPRQFNGRDQDRNQGRDRDRTRDLDRNRGDRGRRSGPSGYLRSNYDESRRLPLPTRYLREPSHYEDRRSRSRSPQHRYAPPNRSRSRLPN